MRYAATLNLDIAACDIPHVLFVEAADSFEAALILLQEHVASWLDAEPRLDVSQLVDELAANWQYTALGDQAEFLDGDAYVYVREIAPDPRVAPLVAAAQIILRVVMARTLSDDGAVCPHGNCRTTTRNAWFCDQCFEALELALISFQVAPLFEEAVS